MDDYVDFEIAKKLKEKGFNEYSGLSYAKVLFDDTEVGLLNDTEIYRETNEFYCYAPTIYQVMKWLRVEKKVHIIIPASFDEGYWWEVRDFNREISAYSVVEYTSYEESVLAGIEYVLDNLI